MQAGADMAATSVHKLGGSMTQSSILNVKEGLVSSKRVQSIISMLTTTSTSYLLLSSLDAARKQLATKGERLISDVIDLAETTRYRINQIMGLSCIGKEILGTKATFDLDPTKLIITVKGLGINGHEVEIWLRENYLIEVEMSDLYNILCIVTLGDTQDKMDILIEALTRLAAEHASSSEGSQLSSVYVPNIPTLALSPRDAFYAETEVVPFEESAGRIIAEFVMVYPPGIPILIPGEIVTEDNLSYIQENVKSGLPVQGPEDETFQTLRVIKEHRAIQ
jgi:lysine decarboxylase